MTAFNDDTFIQNAVAELVKLHGIKSAVETGTHTGGTTPYLATLVPEVYTIEIDPTYYEISANSFIKSGINNIRTFLGNSPDILGAILPNIKGRIFFYLDAHWNDYCPLRDELKVIARHCSDRSVIAIHDFKVPDKEFGYDTYNGEEFCWDYISSLVPDIYPNGFNMSYNYHAEGARRGIIYLEPKFTHDD